MTPKNLRIPQNLKTQKFKTNKQIFTIISKRLNIPGVIQLQDCLAINIMFQLYLIYCLLNMTHLVYE